MVALSTAKINENETVEEFNKRLSQIVQSLHTNVKPPNVAVLIYYVNAFDGELSFRIRQKDPQNIEAAQESAIKIKTNMTTFSKSNLPNFSGASSSRTKPKARVVNTTNPAPDPMTIITKGVK